MEDAKYIEKILNSKRTETHGLCDIMLRCLSLFCRGMSIANLNGEARFMPTVLSKSILILIPKFQFYLFTFASEKTPNDS